MKLQKKVSISQKQIDDALKLVDTTKYVLIGDGVIGSVNKSFDEYFSGKSALVIADTNTYIAAGVAVLTCDAP